MVVIYSNVFLHTKMNTIVVVFDGKTNTRYLYLITYVNYSFFGLKRSKFLNSIEKTSLLLASYSILILG